MVAKLSRSDGSETFKLQAFIGADLDKALRKEQAKIAKANPGVKVTRSEALRVVLSDALGVEYTPGEHTEG